MVRIQEMESALEKVEAEIGPLKETNKLLLSQKDALLAEKTALRCGGGWVWCVHVLVYVFLVGVTYEMCVYECVEIVISVYLCEV